MFAETVAAALEEEYKAQAMAKWWFQTPEIHHEMLLHWKQALMIWEADGTFPEQEARCRQMLLLYDGEGQDSDNSDDIKTVTPAPSPSPSTPTPAERARFQANYEYLMRETARLRHAQEHPQQQQTEEKGSYQVVRKRRHQQQQHHYRERWLQRQEIAQDESNIQGFYANYGNYTNAATTSYFS